MGQGCPPRIEIQAVDEPTAGRNKIKIKIKVLGICGTDIHIYHEEFKSNPPVMLGHEFYDIIDEAEDNVTKFKVGDRIEAEIEVKV